MNKHTTVLKCVESQISRHEFQEAVDFFQGDKLVRGLPRLTGADRVRHSPGPAGELSGVTRGTDPVRGGVRGLDPTGAGFQGA